MKPSAIVALLAVLIPATVSAGGNVATVGGEPITQAELETSLRSDLIQLENMRYEILEEGLDELIAAKLMEIEAKARGTTVDELRRKEIADKITAPTDEEIEQVYEASKAQLGDQTLEDVRGQIVEFLDTQKSAARGQAFVDELKAKHETKIMLAPPVVEVDTGGRPSRGGGPDAPVTIIAFSDYECPYCRNAENTVEQVLNKYGDKLRYVHRDFPLPFHANAHEAAQAAHCAHDQGRFWDYHTMLFSSPQLSTEKFQDIADGLSLDREKFDECLASGRYKDAVDRDMAAGASVGVNGTPAFFVNGRVLSGAQPFQKFEAVIDAELARTGGG